MVEVNADYEKITAEVGTWENLESDAELEAAFEEFVRRDNEEADAE